MLKVEGNVIQKHCNLKQIGGANPEILKKEGAGRGSTGLVHRLNSLYL